MKTVVVIPVYKERLTDTEIISFNRSLKILGSHPIVLVAPDTLLLTEYQQLAEQHQLRISIERFEDYFFKGIDTYNRLLLTRSFYSRFSKYDYMLICQLDTYIFRDELSAWCAEDYDYIGAPLIGHYTDAVFSSKQRVGNGGLSLRKISTFIQAFDFTKNLLSTREIIKRNAVFKKPWSRFPYLLLMKTGFRNNLNYFALNWKYNEDDFWSGFLDNTAYSLKKPDPLKAFEFAFERFPHDCFQLTGKLPFGCHAWEKYEFETFWSKYIPEEVGSR